MVDSVCPHISGSMQTMTAMCPSYSTPSCLLVGLYEFQSYRVDMDIATLNAQRMMEMLEDELGQGDSQTFS
jgi:hypothetical protein